MKRLLRIAEKKERLIIGLMSGTSHDGVDAALVCIKGNGIKTGVNLLYHLHYPYPPEIKRRIEQAFEGFTAGICMLNFELGELFARAALECISKSKVSKNDLDIIASHGQTIYHIPPQGDMMGSTLQIGEADIIAERTGIVTVSDFRKRDMAAGGHGAPLVPYADFLLFREKGKAKAVQNIGGIANVTVVTEKAKDIIAFDTGPGNSLIDEAVRILSCGEKDFDADGRWAERGNLNHDLLDKLMTHSYFKLTPPKSTGVETFGKNLVKELIADNPNIASEDMLATLTCFTAKSIHRAYQDFILPRYSINHIILSGGGSRNSHLFSLLRGFFKDMPIITIDEFGIPSNAKEAVCFAILGNETIMGISSNLPSATGAKRSVVLGKISL
ncbi:MAG: anhydro-N-acetylmuramic acid kinase [Deltaproteobacteria bacterium]|nr:MAG: anhydro-N-acetylmuramic acid kinase [Deltaproteobacteria bacterium]